MNKLKKYDSLLKIKKTIDGKNVVVRKSQFNSGIEYDILDISNQFIGSMRWLIAKLQRMDSRNNDFIMSTIRKNMKIREGNSTDNVSRDISNFITNGEKIII